MPPATQEKQIKTSVGMETASQTASRARKMLEPTISATNLAEPVTPVTVPQPAVETIPAGPLNVARNVSRNAQGFIEAQTAERDRLQELQDTFGGLRDQGSLSDFFTQQREQFGATPANLQELQDIQLRLSDMDTESGLRKVNIESGGQGASQGVRSLTQEDRENAVRTAGLAARAAVIQGNIETATQLARDAVNIEYQQRTLTAQNLLQQIDMVQGQVDDQTAQLLEQEKRGYEAELATIQEVKDNVANAMVNGATQAEIAQLTSDQLGDAEKIALAQSITARGAGEMRNLEIRGAEASIAASNATSRLRNLEIDAMNQPDPILALFQPATARMSFDEFLSNTENQLNMSLAPEARGELRREYDNQVKAMGVENKREQLAQLVATGRMTPAQAEFVTSNLDITTPEQQARQANVIETGQGVLRDIQRALSLADKAGPRAGILAESAMKADANAFTRFTGATFAPGAFELAQHLESVKSNISIEELQRMREASPTGGALGQVPVQQQQYLMTVKGSLNTTLKSSVLKENLNDVYNIYLDAMFGSPEELSGGVKNGKITVDQANAYLQQRKQTSFNEFGLPTVRSGGQNITNLVIAPDGSLINITQ